MKEKISRILTPLHLFVDRCNVCMLPNVYALKHKIIDTSYVVLSRTQWGRYYAYLDFDCLSSALFNEIIEFIVTYHDDANEIDICGSINEAFTIKNPYLGCKTFDEAFIRIDMLGTDIFTKC